MFLLANVPITLSFLCYVIHPFVVSFYICLYYAAMPLS